MTTFIGDQTYYGSSTIRGLSYVARLKTMGTAKYLRRRNILYPKFGALYGPPHAVRVFEQNNPDGRLPLEGESILVKDITHLRCDGLVETCYEKDENIVWWAIRDGATYESIMVAPYYHNDRPDGTVDPEFELSPRAQCGLPSAFGNVNTHFEAIEITEPTILSP